MGAVGGADLAQPAAGLAHDVGDAEGAADLHQLAARDHHLPPRRQGAQQQQHRGGVVVDREGGLGAGEVAEQRLEVGIALAAPAGPEVELEVGGAGRLGHRRQRLRRQRGAAEIGVQHRAGQVQHRARAARVPGQPLRRGAEDGGFRGACAGAGADTRRRPPQSLDHQWPPMLGDQRLRRRCLQQPRDRRRAAERRGADAVHQKARCPVVGMSGMLRGITVPGWVGGARVSTSA